MHELSKIKSIISQVENRLSGEPGKKEVTKVFLSLGRFSSYRPESIRECFKIAAKDTCLEKARVQIREADMPPGKELVVDAVEIE